MYPETGSDHPRSPSPSPDSSSERASLLAPIERARNVALLYAAVSTLFILAAILSDATGRFGYLNDPTILLDPALVALLAWGLSRKSRACAIGLVAVSAFSLLLPLIESGSLAGAIWHVAIIYLGAKAVAATFRYHKHFPSVKRRSGRFRLFVITPLAALGVLLALFFGIGVASEFGLVPSTLALRSDEIRRSDLDTLQRIGAVEAGETVQFFYSGGMLSIEEDGNLFTDRHVVSYERIGEEIWMARVPFEAITHLEFAENDELLGDSRITVYPENEAPFTLIVSNEEGRDREFQSRLDELWKRYRKN